MNSNHGQSPRILPSVCLLVVLAIPVVAQSKDIEVPAGVRLERDVTYLPEERAEKADLYIPKGISPDTRLPAVLWIHGGGWNGGQRDAKREINVCSTLAANGYVAMSIDYKLTQGGTETVWPTNLQDCKTAVRWLRKNADRLQIDPRHIGVMGGSAGGHLASMVALTIPADGLDPTEPDGDVSCAVSCCVDMYGITDITRYHDAKMLGKTLAEAPELYRLASPLTYVRKDSTPFLILHGTADTTVKIEQSQWLDEALTKAGVDHEFLSIPGAPHTFDLQPKQRDLRPVVLGFLDKYLKASSATADTTHGFIAFGQRTYRVDDQGQTTWTYPHATRDGYQLADGQIILTLNKGKRYSGGAVISIATDGQESLIWQGTQSEVNSAQPTDTGTFVITEAGNNPRLLEVNRSGKVLVEFPLQCQKENHHLQTRMARKLSDGSYLVPHLLDFAVLTYDAKGRVTSKIDTTVSGDTEREIHTWPFTAIRHGEGHTLVCCTNGNRVVDFDADGKIVWQLTNDDLPGPWLQDPCGGQVLANGNLVIACYAAGKKDPNTPKLFEINRDKQVVWTYTDGDEIGIHHFQILDTDWKKLDGPILK